MEALFVLLKIYRKGVIINYNVSKSLLPKYYMLI